MEELLRRFVRDDLEAFEALFRQFQGQVYRWVVQIVRDPGVAEDLTVETFWRVYRARSHFNHQRSFGAWTRRIATNVALDHLRRSRHEVSLSEHQMTEVLPDALVQRDIQAAIVRAFDQLPPKLRIVATLSLIEEEPYEAIGEVLGIGVGAVKTRKFRAVRLLRKKLNRMGIKP
jgi:RNA polymerase sigma-70 factor (ECF subfamily)